METDVKEGELIPAEVSEMEDVFQSISQTPKHVAIPRAITRKRVEGAFLTAFELVGGVPRLVHWADGNYGEFIKIYAKLAPKAVEGHMDHTVNVTPPLPPNSLDG